MSNVQMQSNDEELNKPEAENGDGPSFRELWRPVVLLLLVVVLAIAAHVFEVRSHIEEMREWIEDLGLLGPPAFIGVCIIASLLVVPASALMIAAGAMFGSLGGIIIGSIGISAGSAAAFLVSRYIARKPVAWWLETNKEFQRLDKLARKKGAIVVAFARLVPFSPYNLLNFAFGLTAVPFWTYLFWSWLCMMPSMILFAVGTDAIVQAVLLREVPYPLVGLAVVAFVAMVFLAIIAGRKLKANNWGRD